MVPIELQGVTHLFSVLRPFRDFDLHSAFNIRHSVLQTWPPAADMAPEGADDLVLYERGGSD